MVSELFDTINQRISDITNADNFSPINPLSFTTNARELSLQDLLLYIDTFPCFYWQGKTSNDQHFLALGVESTYQTIEHLNKLKKEQFPYYLIGGSNKILSQQSDPIWKSYNQTPYFVPKIVITQKKDEFTVTIAALLHIDYSIKQNTQKISVIQEDEIPSISNWKKTLNLTDNEISQNIYSKIVLSRQKIFHLSSTPLYSILNKLQRKENSYTLIWAINSKEVLIGQSPETLFKLHQNTLYVDSLAGTVKRGESEKDDQRKKDELLNSDKDLHEHRIVTNFLLERLSTLCSNIDFLQKEHVVQLTHVQHLHTKLKGTIRNNISIDSILQSLHPTPAVGGFPQEKIKERISQKESFDRGLYSAPIGFITPDDAEFLVGIRCALAHNNYFYIYAGAGIVAGSEAEKEWQEIEIKMKTMAEVL